MIADLIPITARDLPPSLATTKRCAIITARLVGIAVPLAIADPLNRTSLGPASPARPISLAQGARRQTAKAPGRPSPIGRWMKRLQHALAQHGWAPGSATVAVCRGEAADNARTARWCCCSTARTGSSTHCCRWVNRDRKRASAARVLAADRCDRWRTPGKRAPYSAAHWQAVIDELLPQRLAATVQRRGARAPPGRRPEATAGLAACP